MVEEENIRTTQDSVDTKLVLILLTLTQMKKNDIGMGNITIAARYHIFKYKTQHKVENLLMLYFRKGYLERAHTSYEKRKGTYM